MRRSLGGMLLLAATAISAAAFAPAASAETYHNEWEPLQFTTTDKQKCIQRKIWLKRGDYQWQLFTRKAGWDAAKFSSVKGVKRLRSGSYMWEDCVVYRALDATRDPLKGPSEISVTSRLWGIAHPVLGAENTEEFSAKWSTMSRDGRYLYGSWLQRKG